MHIQWFPGHMTKALRMMEENIKLVDCLIYLLDSRCIAASFNPKLNELAGDKPILYVLNKSDLVEREDLSNWLKYLKNNNMNVVICNSANGNTQKVIEGLKVINKNLIEKYLNKNEKQKRQKILIVDDSAIILKAITDLLSSDYEISTAQSGFSAIRTLVLDKPDLILLDYEMPVCDGRQVLEMIRSEKEIADTPVIFLTGRSDKESIQKVLSLKPAGYLIKTLKPDEIKKNIDSFFEKKAKK